MATPTEQLGAVRLALSDCKIRGETLANSISDSAWVIRPNERQWSPAECFQHLNLTTAGMLPLLEAGAKQARLQQWKAQKPFSPSLLARLLRCYLEPPYRTKSKTLQKFSPFAAAPKAEVLGEWKRSHLALDQFIVECRGFDLGRPMITSPFNQQVTLRYSVYSALLIMAAHERRHLWQASQAAAAI